MGTLEKCFDSRSILGNEPALMTASLAKPTTKPVRHHTAPKKFPANLGQGLYGFGVLGAGGAYGFWRHGDSRPGHPVLPGVGTPQGVLRVAIPIRKCVGADADARSESQAPRVSPNPLRERR